MQRKSSIAFFMALPLILLITLLVLYPALYSVHLPLNKSMQRFVGIDNFLFLFKRRRSGWWCSNPASCHHGRRLQGHHRLLRRPFRPQHPGQGPAQVARHAAGAVGHSAGHELPCLAVAVRSSHSAFN
jgi:ABC-type sugar transport system permease subunit